MANEKANKIVYNGSTLIDLTSDTATANKVLNGFTFHTADGNQATGNVSFITYYTGNNTPSSSLGSDGDIYLKT